MCKVKVTGRIQKRVQSKDFELRGWEGEVHEQRVVEGQTIFLNKKLG